MNDMSQVIVPKSDQINADDLISGPMTITIRDVQISGGQEQPVSIYFEGSDKAFRPCKSMSRVLVYGWGPDAKVYVGRSLTLYRDPQVKWGGMAVGGIRISHMSHIDSARTMVLAVTKGSRKPYKVLPLAMDALPRQDDAGRRFATAYIAKLATLETPTELGAFIDSKGAKLAELQTARPELHAEVKAAIDARAAQLAPAPASFDVDLDDDLGESAPHPASATADRLLGEIELASTFDELKAIEKASELDRAAMPDHMAGAIQSALDKAHARVKALAQ